ncbi:MAG: 3-deoxy-D-manno-octulosonic acid transferase [Opitutales bacterium]
MLWVYRILFLPLLLLSAPYYLWRMLRRGGYGEGFGQRLGLFPTLPAKRPGVSRVWIQAVSVGEVEAIGPLLAHLRDSGRAEVVLTTTTSTGYRLARERHAAACLAIGVFPLDFWPCSAAAWRRIQPDTVVLTEGELWPEHLLGQARRRGVPAILINARLSDRSLARHRRTPRVAASLLGTFAWIGAGSEEDARRLVELGAPTGRVETTGNLKFDVAAEGALPPRERAALREELGFGDNPDALVLLGSSTWPGEETLLIGTLAKLRAQGIDARLLLVPRHAERRDEVVRELTAANLAFHQRSSQGAQAKPGTVIHLADTTGELRRLTRAADLAFSGKSLPPHDGGQTPVECAAAGVPLAYGPAMSNFRSICDGLQAVGAARRGSDATEVAHILTELACDAPARARMGAAATAWHTANRGATERTATQLLAQLR